MIITAVVVCDDRLDGPDSLALVGGVPMAVRAVRSVLASEVAEHVDVLVRADRIDAVEQACRGLPVSVRAGLAPVRTHADQRAGTHTGDGSVTTRLGGVLLLHDANRPLAPPGLVSAVVDAVRQGHPAAVPVLPMTDTVTQVDRSGLLSSSPDRATLRVLQTPLALDLDVLDPDVLDLEPLPAPDPMRLVLRLLESGVAVHCVPGHPLAFPLRTAWDLELADLLTAPGSSG